MPIFYNSGRPGEGKRNVSFHSNKVKAKVDQFYQSNQSLGVGSEHLFV